MPEGSYFNTQVTSTRKATVRKMRDTKGIESMCLKTDVCVFFYLIKAGDCTLHIGNQSDTEGP